MIIYGIKNCNTMQKAFALAQARGMAYSFHDYKKAGIGEAQLRQWIAQTGSWEALVNKQGLTWKKLDESIRQHLDETGALALMQQQPSVIKRPIVEAEQQLFIGGEAIRYLEK